jgi:hypothetical protein
MLLDGFAGFLGVLDAFKIVVQKVWDPFRWFLDAFEWYKLPKIAGTSIGI